MSLGWWVLTAPARLVWRVAAGWVRLLGDPDHETGRPPPEQRCPARGGCALPEPPSPPGSVKTDSTPRPRWQDTATSTPRTETQ